MDGSLKTTSGSLTSTAGALKTTAGALSGTAMALVGTSSSLNDTASVLKSLAASLADTSNVLNSVHDVGGQILGALRHTQSNPERQGTEDLWMKADETLAVRAAAERDSANIVAGITDVNKHLQSICTKLPLPGDC